jgi:hypothetical protein
VAIIVNGGISRLSERKNRGHMKPAIKLQLVIGALFLSATSFVSATEWTGKMSCGALQNFPNAKSVAPFAGAVTLTIDGNRAVLGISGASPASDRQPK